jgi:hypothetical protein
VKLFHILAILLTASAVFSYINHRFLKLPTVIGIMLVALVLFGKGGIHGWLSLLDRKRGEDD